MPAVYTSPAWLEALSRCQMPGSVLSGSPIEETTTGVLMTNRSGGLDGSRPLIAKCIKADIKDETRSVRLLEEPDASPGD